MKILFKNKTKYTKDCYQQYLHFHQSKYGLRYQFTTIVIILMLSFCILMNLNYKNYIALILLLPFLCTFIYHQFYHPKKIITKELESDKFEKEKTFTFKFYEKYFTITCDGIGEKLKYSNLHRVFETADYFYLYIDKTHSLLLDKSGFTVGNISKFLRFLKRKRWHLKGNF